MVAFMTTKKPVDLGLRKFFHLTRISLLHFIIQNSSIHRAMNGIADLTMELKINWWYF